METIEEVRKKDKLRDLYIKLGDMAGMCAYHVDHIGNGKFTEEMNVKLFKLLDEITRLTKEK